MKFSETLGVRTNEAVFLWLSRSISFNFSEIIENSENNTDVAGWTDEIHHYFYRWIIGVEMHVWTSFLQLSSLEIGTSVQDWMLLYTRYTRNFLCQSIQFSFSVIWKLFSKFQVFSEPGPMYMKYPGLPQRNKLHFLRLSEMAHHLLSVPLKNRNFVHHSHN